MIDFNEIYFSEGSNFTLAWGPNFSSRGLNFYIGGLISSDLICKK